MHLLMVHFKQAIAVRLLLYTLHEQQMNTFSIIETILLLSSQGESAIGYRTLPEPKVTSDYLFCPISIYALFTVINEKEKKQQILTF